MNLNNLEILANYLASLPKDYDGFNMAVFCQTDDGEGLDPAAHTCGSSMCAVGHGPNAGIAPSEDDDYCWVRYSERVFGERWSSDTMQFCFSGLWDLYFPNIEHAIRRLRYVVAYGSAPESFSFHLENHYLFGDI